jgi:hypothetical protein
MLEWSVSLFVVVGYVTIAVLAILWLIDEL